MKNGILSIVVLLYFVGSVSYMLAYPTNHHHIQTTVYSWLRAFFYVMNYGCFLYFVWRSKLTIHNSSDLFSVLFLKIYLGFKVVLFSFLLANDLPTYVRVLDSKIISLFLSIFVLIFTLLLFIINYDRYKKFLG